VVEGVAVIGEGDTANASGLSRLRHSDRAALCHYTCRELEITNDAGSGGVPRLGLRVISRRAWPLRAGARLLSTAEQRGEIGLDLRRRTPASHPHEGCDTKRILIDVNASDEPVTHFEQRAL
jgi:hypothetical protein